MQRFGLGSPKKITDFSTLCGASRKAPKKLPNRQKPPNGEQKYPEKRVFDNLKLFFWYYKRIGL
jgi:hypothetical protein